jgi:hypothetical protein
MLLDTLPWVAAITAIGVGGWLLHTWMRIKHGYPLDGAWGQAIYPTKNNETVERIRLLTTENAQLRAELGAIKDRLQNVERIVTDQPSQLAREIEQLQ